MVWIAHRIGDRRGRAGVSGACPSTPGDLLIPDRCDCSQGVLHHALSGASRAALAPLAAATLTGIAILPLGGSPQHQSLQLCRGHVAQVRGGQVAGPDRTSRRGLNLDREESGPRHRRRRCPGGPDERRHPFLAPRGEGAGGGGAPPGRGGARFGLPRPIVDIARGHSLGAGASAPGPAAPRTPSAPGRTQPLANGLGRATRGGWRGTRIGVVGVVGHDLFQKPSGQKRGM